MFGSRGTVDGFKGLQGKVDLRSPGRASAPGQLKPKLESAEVAGRARGEPGLCVRLAKRLSREPGL